MTNRSILSMILLTIVTLGIYMIYWTVSFQSELKQKTNEGFGGLAHLILIFATFGIYYAYWQYAAGIRIKKLGGQDYSVLYLVLFFVGFAWLNPYLMQNEVNKLKK